MNDDIIDILNSSIIEGYTPEEIKESIVKTLYNYFNNKTALQNNAITSELLYVYEYFIKYHYDTLFFDGLKEVLQYYRMSFNENSKATIELILNTQNDFIEKENMMWTIRQNIPNKQINDIYDFSIAYFKYIGDVLEIGTKHIIFELYNIFYIINKKVIDYNIINKIDFGVAINNLCEHGYFKDFLITKPLSLKISDWRNIAYHNSFTIQNGNIKCTYCKHKKSFIINNQQLQDYLHQVIRASNIINIGRCIFIYDILDDIEVLYNDKNITNSFRKPLLINRFKVSISSQGFNLIGINNSNDISEVIISDMQNDGSFDENKLIQRELHSSQFLYHVWEAIPNKIIKIIYCDKFKNALFSSSIDGIICQQICDGKEEFSNMAKYIKFIKYKK